jgi:hypothetical protein
MLNLGTITRRFSGLDSEVSTAPAINLGTITNRTGFRKFSRGTTGSSTIHR